MTPKELRRRVSGLISATPGMPVLDQATIHMFYYDAALKAMEFIDVAELKSQVLIDLVAGQKDYLLPAGIVELVDVQWLNQNTGYYENLHSVELSTLSQYRGQRLVYARAGVYRVAGADYGKYILRLSMEPEASVAEGLIVSYRQKPSTLDSLNDNDPIVDFPDNVLALIPYQIAFYWFSQQGAKAIKELGANYGQYFDNECVRINARLGERHNADVRREILTDWGGICL